MVGDGIREKKIKRRVEQERGRESESINKEIKAEGLLSFVWNT